MYFRVLEFQGFIEPGHEADRLRDRREDAGDVEVAVVIRDQDVTLFRVEQIEILRAEVDSRRPDE